MKNVSLTLFISAFFLNQAVVAQDANELAQKLQNPLASITALPIQNNFLTQASQSESLAYNLSFQPIFSTNLERFNIIHRAVFGVGYAPGILEGLGMLPVGAPQDGKIDGSWGISDLNYSFYYTKLNAGKIPWGIGPSITLPIASDNRLGTGKWSAGISAVIVYQTGKWTFDIVARQTWSFAGDDERADVNQMVINPLIAYNIGKGWALSTFPTISVNWDFEDDNLTLPVGGGISKLIFHGKLPVSYQLQYYSYVVRPGLAPKQEFRLAATLVFSK